MARTLITTGEFAKRIGVHPRTVRRMISAGKIRGYRVGSLLRIDEDEIAQILVPVPTRGA